VVNKDFQKCRYSNKSYCWRSDYY